MEHQEYLDHFSKEISTEIKQYATEEVFKFSRYIFYRSQGKKQYGYCTYCKKEFNTDGLKHNITAECPVCKSQCTAKGSGMGRMRMIDGAYFVYYEKSVIDPQVLIARGIYAVRDYRVNFYKVETEYLVKTMYVFKMGDSAMLVNNGYYSWTYGKIESYSMRKSKTVYSVYSQYPNEITMYCRESIKDAVKGTPFQYSTYQEYENGDMVKFFDLYSKYPCIEYLTKLKMTELVTDKLLGHNTYSAINWRGKTLQHVLRLSKKEINEIRKTDIPITSLFLKLLQISIKDNSKLSFDEISTIIRKKYCHYIKELQKILQYTTLRRADTYIGKQFAKKNKDKRYYSQDQVVGTWKDYVDDCLKLEMDLTMERVLFPSNLHQAHQNTIKQVKIKGDAILDKKIKTRLKSLEKYCYNNSELIIRPAASSLELIEEGKALHHCVGTYAERYAKGELDILLIRKISEPSKPYFTVEVKKDIVRQVRGKNNCSPTQDISKLVEEFKDKNLTKKKDKLAVSA